MSAHLTLAVSREPPRIPTLAQARAEGRCQRCFRVRTDGRTSGIRDRRHDRWGVFYLCLPRIEAGRAEGWVIVA